MDYWKEVLENVGGKVPSFSAYAPQIFFPFILLFALLFLLAAVFFRVRRGESAFLPSIATFCVILLLFMSGSFPLLLRFGQEIGEENVTPPVFPYLPRTDRYEVGIILNEYSRLENGDIGSFLGGTAIYGFIEKGIGNLYLFHYDPFIPPPFTFSGAYWAWHPETGDIYLQARAPVSYSVTGRRISFFIGAGDLSLPVVSSDKYHIVSAPVACANASPESPLLFISGNLPKSVIVVVENEAYRTNLYVNDYGFNLIFLSTRNLRFEVMTYENFHSVDMSIFNRNFPLRKIREENLWGEIRYFWGTTMNISEDSILNTDFKIYGDGNKIVKGWLLSSFSLSIDTHHFELSPLLAFRFENVKLVRSKELPTARGLILSMEYIGYLPALNHYVKAYVCAHAPITSPPPPPPPIENYPDLSLSLNYSISSYAFSDGILISAEATFVDGSFLPDGTKVSLLSPVATDLIRAEKDEWICKIPLEYQGANGTLRFSVPGYLPKYVYFTIAPLPEQERTDLRVYLYDQQTGNLAQGTFGVSVDGITKMGNPCVFEGVPTRVTISVNQISGDVKYYPAQETVNLSPWSSNTVNIYLTRVPEPESGDASVLIRVHVTDKPKLYFNGKESVVVWNPQGYWENKMENLKGGVEYCVSATCPGYYSQSIDITTQKGMTTFVDIYLEKMEPSQPVIWIRVYTENKPSVYVNDKSIALYPATSYKGIYWWNKVVAELGRNYIIKATCPGYIPEERIVRPESPKAQLLVDFFLSPEPHYEKPKTTLLTRVHVTTAKPTVYLDGKELPVVWRKGVWENLLEDIKEGIYTVRALCPGYYAETITVKVRDGETSVVDIYLSPENYRDNIETFLCTRIHSKDKPKLLVDGRETPVVWNVAGYWENTMKALGGKKYTITASCLGYQTKTVEVTAIERKTTVVDIYLSPENYKKETSLLIRVYVENKPNLKIDGKEAVVIRNPKGYWENKIENAVGGKTYVIYVSCPGYIGRKILATAVEGKITVVDVYLSPETRSKKPDEKFPNGTLDVTVLDRMTKLALPGVKIILSDGKEGTTNANGKAVFYNLQEGEYTVTAILEGYFDVTKKVIISGGRTTNLTINLSSYLFVAKEKPLYPERILLLLLLIFIASGAILVWRRR